MDPAWVDPSRPSNKELCAMVNKNAMEVVQEGGVGSFMERFFRKDGSMGMRMYTLQSDQAPLTASQKIGRRECCHVR
jgi:hypothetical protein